MSIELQFQTLSEKLPDQKWQEVFNRLWPGYRAWFLRSGVTGRPSYLECRKVLRTYMPELVPVWERLIELSGGGDVESRFLSLWCPPPYIAGCTQGIWFDPKQYEEPMLIRNYDFAPVLLEGNWWKSCWSGQQVLAMSDCLWGALDGMNESGLSASLSFGGRTVSGVGFGVPLVVRYLLEVAENVSEAVDILKRIPVHMSYNITLLDRSNQWATVFVNPDRPTEVVYQAATSNFQHQVEWPQHAEATHAVERLNALQHKLPYAVSSQDMIQTMLSKPLYQDKWLSGYGTLYSAVYYPMSNRAELWWPQESWAQSLDNFSEGQKQIYLKSY